MILEEYAGFPITLMSFLIDPHLYKLYYATLVNHYVFAMFNPDDIGSYNNYIIHNINHISTRELLIFYSVLLFREATMKDEDRSISTIKKYLTGISFELPSGNVCIDKDQYVYHYTYILLYESDNTFSTYYKANKKHRFYFYNYQVEEEVGKEINVALVFSLSGENKDIEAPLFNSAISGFYSIKNSLTNYNIKYKVFDTESNDNCEEIAKSILNQNISFILGGINLNCFVNIHEAISNTSIIYIYPSLFSGQSCFKNVVFTGGVPNQFFSNTFSHFSPFFSKNTRMYIFYESLNPRSYVSYQIIIYTVNSTGIVIVSYDLSNKNILDIEMYVNEMKNENGLILFLGDLYYFELLSSELYIKKMYSENYPFVLYFVTLEELKRIPNKYKENIYVFGSYFQENDSFSNDIYEYTIMSNTTYSMSSVYIAFIFIKELLLLTPVDSDIKVDKLYNVEFDIYEGKISLASNNIFSKKYELAQIVNGKYNIIINYTNPTYPDAYDWFLTPNIICDFSDPDIMERGHQDSMSYMFVVYPQSSEDYSLLGVVNTLLSQFNGKGGLNSNRVIFKYTQPSTIEGCKTYAELFNQTSSYLSLYIFAPIECINEFIKINPVKPINILSQYDDPICIENVFFSGLYSSMYIKEILIQLTIQVDQVRLLLINSEKYNNYYDNIYKVANGLLINVVDRLSFESDILTDVIEYVKLYSDNLFIVMDGESEDMLNIVNEVNDIISFDGKDLYFLSFYCEYDWIVDTIHFYKITSTPRIYEDTEKKIRSALVSDLLYNSYQSISDSMIYDRFSNKVSSLYLMFQFWILINQIQTSESSVSSTYLTLYNSIEGEIYMQENNRLMKSISYSYLETDNTVVEILLGPRKSNINVFVENNKIELCSWINKNGFVDVDVIKIGIAYPARGAFMQLCKYSFLTLINLINNINVQAIQRNTYYLSPIIKDTNSTYEGANKALQELYKENISLIFTYFFSFSVDKTLFNKDTLYINVGFSSFFKYPEYFVDFGLSISILSFLYYCEIIKYSYDVHMIRDDSKRSEYLYNNLNARLKMSSINQYDYIIDNIENENVAYNITKDIKESCENTLSGGCVIIISCIQKESEEFFKVIHNFDMTSNDNILIYTLYLLRDESTTPENLKGIRLIETYAPEINDYDYDFLGPQIKQFEEFKIKNVPSLVFTHTIMENAYVAVDILDSLLIRQIPLTNISMLVKTLSYHQYSTPSGSIYINRDLISQKRYFTCKIKDKNLNYDIISSTELLSPPMYDIKSDDVSDEYTIIGLVLDYHDIPNKRLSHLLLLLFENLIRDENNQGGVMNRMLSYEVIPIYMNDTDSITIRNLYDNQNIQVIFGCHSQYSYSLISENIDKYDKILFSINFPYYPICNKNIIHVRPSLRTVIDQSIYSLINTSYNDIVIVISNDLNKISEVETIVNHIHEYIKNNTNFNILTTLVIKDENYTNSFIGLFEIISNSPDSVIILNMLDYKHLICFENLYINYGLSYLHELQVIYDMDEYLVGNDIILNLAGNYLIRTYSGDNSMSTTINFENYIENKIGSIEYITESLSSLETAFKVYLAGLKQAQSLADIDNLNNTWPEIDYLRRGTQLIDITTSSGQKQGSSTNYIISTLEIVEISSSAKVVKIDNKDIRIQLKPEIYYSSEKCDCGPLQEKYQISIGIYVTIYSLSCIVILLVVIEVALLCHYRRFKIIKAASYNFLIYYLISGIIVIVCSLLAYIGGISTITCMLTQGFLYGSLTNYTAILVLRTWRIHAVYYNTGIKRQRITNEKVYARLFSILFLFAFITVIWGLLEPYSVYEETESKEYSSIVKIVYIPTCTKNIYYMLFQCIILAFLFVYGIYFSWTTRKTGDIYNDSKSLSATIASLAILEILYLVIETILYTNPEAKFILENLGMCLVILISTSIIILPKFYRLYKEYEYMKPDSQQKENIYLPQLSSPYHNKVVPVSANTSTTTKSIMKKTSKNYSINRSTYSNNYLDSSHNADVN